MFRPIFFLLFLIISSGKTFCQDTDTVFHPPVDTIIKKDSAIIPDNNQLIPAIDSVSKAPRISKYWFNTLPWDVLKNHPYFGFASNLLEKPVSNIHHSTGKERMFYLLIFLLLIYAVLKQLFPKYFADLFRLFFRTTLKQRQVKEQLMQTPLPSILLNGFFVLSTGLYITLVLEHFDLNPAGNFWILLLYCYAGLAAIYLVKFVGLKITGWLFSMQEVADSYIFIVFIVNKMIGLLLLPFLVLLAFSTGNLYTIALTLSWCLVGALLIYRFILTYVAIRNQVRVNLFHFFLYLCAFEIAPLLLIYRGLLLFFGIST